MPPLHKALSEQGTRASPKHRQQHQQWQRSKSNPIAKAPPPQRPQPLAPISESTKNKLKGFQFDSKISDDTHENPLKAPKPKVTLPAPGKENKQTSPKPTSRAKVSTTPVNRLAWEDLLGNQNTSTADASDPSPSERLTWRTDIFKKETQRHRKRARSSSPIPSPAPASSAGPSVDRKGLSEVLKTPHADPAVELWDRFSVPGIDASPSGLTNPLLANLMVSSSPRPNKANSGPRSEKSLRKSLSCGTNWPKRRRSERTERVVEVQTVTDHGSPQPNAKTTMVSALLETVDTELRRSFTEEIDMQPLSSPSPTKRSQKPNSDVSSRDTTSPADLPAEATIAERSVVVVDSSSDYGDDDFDDDTLMELDATIGAALCEKHESPVVTAPKMPPPQPIPAPPAATTTAEEDFGDFDDDFFDGAEDLLAQVESQQPQQQAQQAEVVRPAHNSAILGQDDFDEFGDDFGEDFDPDAAELAATQHSNTTFPPPSHATQKVKAIQRYLVNNVLEESYTDAYGNSRPEKLLIVQADRTNTSKKIHLRDDWYDTQASVGAYVHIIGTFEPSGRCVIDNQKNMIILHPDQLISATVIADSFGCMRRAVLQDRVKATSEASEPLVYGTLLHEIFQQALMENKWDIEYLGSIIDKALDKHMEDLYVMNVSKNAARDHLCSKMTEIRGWAQAFVSPYPRPGALVQGRNGDKANMCVSKLLDVEEHVWSPMYGLKGNIDATVQVTIRDATGSKTLTVPFEVKTGKNTSTAHEAQTALYNLLLSDRYDIDVSCGILYYTETSQTRRIPAVKQELRHMIMQRNQLACHIRERSVQLPPMKKNAHACGKCYAQASCFIYHKLADDGNGETSALGQKFDQVVKHLTPVHKEFFLKWEDLLTKEEKESQKLRRELWTMVSTEREKVGRCFSNVILEAGSGSEDLTESKINRFSYTLIKENPPPKFSFFDSQLNVGEAIVISDEQGHFALALGYVTAVQKHRISVAVDRRLHNARIRQPGFNEVDNQVFASIMATGPEEFKTNEAEEPVIRYRLDKDEFSNGMATVRNNLVQIMTNSSPGAIKTRRLVVDLEPPKAKQKATQYHVNVHGSDSLNSDQTAAVEKVMSAEDYALVLGMPGTGKTTTIAHIIRALISQGKSVLLTSYTHTAVDNILLKLKHDNVPILRLGAVAKIHPDVRDFVTIAQQPMESFEEIERAWLKSPVVATTCLGINHPLFQMRTFDYCIVDEASQITLPICLGPIRMANTFVLVGDHNQLPPLVQNKEALEGGLDISLFKLLSDKHPESVVNLEHQYRMCEDIMGLSNALIYNGRLKCGTESLRFASLSIPNMNALSHRHLNNSSIPSPRKQRQHAFCPGPQKGTCWLRDLLDPEIRVRFINTDLLPDSREEAKGNRIVNPCEAKVVAQLVDALLTVGVPAEEIGVMTHYRSQLALLKHVVKGTLSGTTASTSSHATAGGGYIPSPNIEMHTADRFQGRDKDVVVLSLVRSNEQSSIGELLKDWRRINVAFTRAKTKLLVVGSRSTLSGAGKEEMLVRFMSMMEGRGWVYDLRPGALEGHLFDGPVPSFSAPVVSKVVPGPEVDMEEEEIVGRGSWEDEEDPYAPGSCEAVPWVPFTTVMDMARTKSGSKMVVTSSGSVVEEPCTTTNMNARGGTSSGMNRTREPKRVQVGSSTVGVGEKRRRGPQLLSRDVIPGNNENVPPPRGSCSSSSGGKNNYGAAVKRARVGDRAILKGKPVLRDILNDLANGGY
ncbi:tripartite DNA replication factor [Rhypophila sp. PSN 637]